VVVRGVYPGGSLETKSVGRGGYIGRVEETSSRAHLTWQGEKFWNSLPVGATKGGKGFCIVCVDCICERRTLTSNIGSKTINSEEKMNSTMGERGSTQRHMAKLGKKVTVSIVMGKNRSSANASDSVYKEIEFDERQGWLEDNLYLAKTSATSN